VTATDVTARALSGAGELLRVQHADHEVVADGLLRQGRRVQGTWLLAGEAARARPWRPAEPDARRPTHRRVQIHFDKMLTTEPYHTTCCTPYHWCGCLSVSGQVMAVAPMQCMANVPCQCVLCQCLPGAEMCGIFKFFGGLDDADALANTIKAARNDFAKRKGLTVEVA
jgi:hypothetical protein